MNITLLTIGKCRDKALLALCAEYTKRLGPYWPTQVVELAERSGYKSAEAALIYKYLSKHKPGTYTLFALDEHGQHVTSPQFADVLAAVQHTGVQNLSLLIGGADGLEESLKKDAAKTIALSKMTLPHMLVRPLVLEQIYRAATILNNHPYHRA